MYLQILPEAEFHHLQILNNLRFQIVWKIYQSYEIPFYVLKNKWGIIVKKKKEKKEKKEKERKRKEKKGKEKPKKKPKKRKGGERKN